METPWISCEFSYYLVTNYIALLGLVLLAIAARIYQYSALKLLLIILTKQS